MDDKRLAKIAKNDKSDHLDSLQNVGTKVEHEHNRRTGILDKIQNMVLEEKGKEEENPSKD